MVSVVIAYIVDAFVFKIQSVSVRKHCEIHGEIYNCNCHESEEFRRKKANRGSLKDRNKWEELRQWTLEDRDEQVQCRKLEITCSSLKETSAKKLRS